MTIPDFFLVGGPKCGTATLSNWLAQHPDIFICEPREPNFFGSDLCMQRHDDTLAAYLQRFDAKGDRIAGEGTTWYLYSRAAPGEIHDLNPAAKIVMILRDPVAVTCSLHNYRIYYGNEDETDLGRVLDRESELLDRWADNGEARNVMQIYRDVARYTDGIARYLETFSPSQVQVLWFEDLRDRPASMLRQVYEFLDVDPEFQTIMDKRNEGGTYKSDTVRRLLLQPSGAVRSAARLLPQSWRLHIGRAIRRANTDYGGKPPVESALLDRLRRELRPDVDRLEVLLDADLSDWCRQTPQNVRD